MVGVFAVFAMLPFVDLKEMGIGLAVAVLIDATLVRAVLLPASMKLLGDANWYLPSWLQWLPRLEHGTSSEPIELPSRDRARRLGGADGTTTSGRTAHAGATAPLDERTTAMSAYEILGHESRPLRASL